MQIVDTGVLTPSFMDFSLPSEFPKSTVYYCRIRSVHLQQRLPDRTKRH